MSSFLDFITYCSGAPIESWLSASASGYGANAWDVIRKNEIARD